MPAERSTPPRWGRALGLGLALAIAAFALSFIAPRLLAGAAQPPWALALVGVLQLALMPPVLALARRAGQLPWRALGITRSVLAADVALGLAVAAAFALLQFGLLIPLTGGAQRSDVVANLAQMAGGPGMVAGLGTLAVLGALAEELLFRGLLLHALLALLRRVRGGAVLAVLLVTLLFGALHGYQGWAGVIDTALYGGLALSLLTLWRGGRITAALAAHAGWNALAVACLLWLYR